MNGTVAKLRGSDRNSIQPGSEIIIPTKGPKRGGSELLALGLNSTTNLATLLVAIAGLK